MNDELVKYGKEKISEAITEKGVPTSTSDSFDKMAENIGAIKSEYNNGDLNIFCQTAQPTAQNGLWIKRNSSEINNILIKDNYYLEDGIAGRLPVSFPNETNGSPVIICGIDDNNKMTIAGFSNSGSTNLNSTGTQILVNLNDNTAENISVKYFSGYMGNISNYFTYDNHIFFIKYGNKITDNYDMINYQGPSNAPAGTTYNAIRFDNLGPSSGTYLNAVTLVDNILYGVAIYYNTSNSNKPTTAYFGSFDMTTLTKSGSSGTGQYCTLLSSINISNYNLSNIHYNTPSVNYKLIYYGNKLYYFENTNLIFSYDLSDNSLTPINTSVLPVGYSTDQRPLAIGYLAGNVYFIGINNNPINDNIITDIAIYNIPNNTCEIKKNVIPSDMTYPFKYPYVKKYGYCQKGNDIYIVGACHEDATQYRNAVTKYSIKSNTYETGTILCQPSATSNLTKMYSSDLITLNYGIDDVYYQAADGLHKQDAAIIKDGVVTDI